jgi:hypothetical protein
MKRSLTIPAAIAMLLLLAVPAQAQERGDSCPPEPESVYGEMPIVCGEISVNLEADATATLESVLERSAPEAEVPIQGESLSSWILAVPVGDEWSTVQALEEDPDVESASLIGSGDTVVPDTAVARIDVSTEPGSVGPAPPPCP